MADDLQDRILQIRKKHQANLSEEATKQGVVLPLLGRLGWDRDNIEEVKPEYTVGQQKVDYCLLNGDRPLVFLEVTPTGKGQHAHQEQLLDCAQRRGVTLAALTEGMVWWLFLPMQSGPWEQRRFLTIDLKEQDASEVAGHFRKFLAKEAVLSGEAVAAAKALLESKSKDSAIREAIPKAWLELCQAPSEQLLKLFADRVERLCGHRPDHALLAEHLAHLTAAPAAPRGRGAASSALRQAKPAAAVAAAPAPAAAPDGEKWTFRRPVSFRFLDATRDALTYKDILLGLGEMLYERHRGDFLSKVSTIRNYRGRIFLSHDLREYQGMLEPMQIGDSGIYVETSLGPDDIRARCHEMLRVFGYAPGQLHVTFREAQE